MSESNKKSALRTQIEFLNSELRLTFPGLENFFTIGNEKVHDKSAVLCIYNDNTGVLVEVVFVELVWCSGGSVRPGTLDSLRWLLWWESCTCGPTVHILILRRSSSVVKGGSESLKSKRSRSRFRRLGEHGLDR